MKRIIFIIAMLIPAACFVFGQSADEQSIRKTLNETALGVKNQDVTVLGRIYANDYTFVSPSGVLSGKQDRLATIKSGKPFEYFSYEDMKVRIYGNTAVVTTGVKNKVTGQDEAQAKATLTMVKNDGRWQIVAGQATPVVASNQSGMNEEQALMKIEQELVDALIKGDVSANERYLADTYIFTAPDGTVMNKEQGIADLKSGDLKFESSKLDDMKVQSYGNTAVVTYRTTDKGNYKGNDLSGQYRWTDVFVKQSGRWQIVAGHGARLAQPK